jgi:hypothetical protein
VSLSAVALVLGLGTVAMRGAASQKPAAPVLVSPANGATNVAANPTLSWSSAANATSYDVNFGTQNPPAPYWTTWTGGTTFNKTTTTPGTRYYWQIVAKNASGTTKSQVWSFTTATGAAPPPPPPPPPATLTISCPADQNVTATSSSGIAVSYPAPTVSGGTAPISVSSSPTSGSVFPVGMTTVTAMATDATQQKASCSFMVNVAAPTTGGSGGSTGTNSAAMGLWTPAGPDTCTQAQHDAYSVIGPDGKRYPTWHPPTGPNGCTFGHEHGHDPSGSNLYADITAFYGGVLFGYGNETLDTWNTVNGITTGMRHEDHVGHKIEWANDVTIYESTTAGGSGAVALAVKCDFFMKIHQGTHSKDAFTNNMHELLYAMQCHDGPGGAIGSKVIITKMVVFGKPGGFSEGSVAGGFTFIPVGTATPTNSPTGSGLRSLPTINRVLQSMLVPPGQWSDTSQGLYEDWISANYIQVPGQSNALVYFDPHFAVFTPSRFYWPGTDSNTYGITRSAADIASNMGRSVDVCWMQRVDSSGVVYKARGGECDILTNYGSITTPIAYDDPRSLFNGVHREFYFNNTVIVNPGSLVHWYTDPFGNNASVASSAGMILQYISNVDNRYRNASGYIDPNGTNYPLESIAIGKNNNYGGSGVHAPN